jgi:hypothetical protein
MTMEQILEILINRSTNLSQQRSMAIKDGDLHRVVKIDEELLATQISVQKILDSLNKQV